MEGVVRSIPNREGVAPTVLAVPAVVFLSHCASCFWEAPLPTVSSPSQRFSQAVYAMVSTIGSHRSLFVNRRKHSTVARRLNSVACNSLLGILDHRTLRAGRGPRFAFL